MKDKNAAACKQTWDPWEVMTAINKDKKIRKWAIKYLHHKRLNNLIINQDAKIITMSIVIREQGRDNGGALTWYPWRGVNGNQPTVTTFF